MRIIEKVILGIIVFGLFGDFQEISWIGDFIVLGTIMLVILYLIAGLIPEGKEEELDSLDYGLMEKGKTIPRLVVNFMFGIYISMNIFAFTFGIKNYPGFIEMFSLSLMFLPFAILYTYLRERKNFWRKLKSNLVRILGSFLIVSILVYYTNYF